MMNFLSAEDFSKSQIEEIFEIADQLKAGKSELALKPGAIAVLLFEKPSTRTRISFEVAMIQLGGNYIFINPATTQLSRGESWSDTARVLSDYVDFIICRLYKHDALMEIVKSSTVPVINALTDQEHPTQALGDLYTIRESKGKLKGLKMALFGDTANNTFNSLMIAGTMMGMEIALVGPKSYLPNVKFVSKAKEYGIVKTFDDVQEGAEGADVLYTDTFVSMGEEAEADLRRKLFMPYQLNQSVLDIAEPKALVMHPLPAHRGEEITGDVLDGKQSIAFEQAKNKLLIEKAIILYIAGKEA
ncbi:MAG: ornithine carbamoyltransferase [Candidatus Micrarchaeota archaeon]|nr:ornithine carbamoyltransferase [Candidatus Micrarchaeota archaeon]